MVGIIGVLNGGPKSHQMGSHLRKMEAASPLPAASIDAVVGNHAFGDSRLIELSAIQSERGLSKASSEKASGKNRQ